MRQLVTTLIYRFKRQLPCLLVTTLCAAGTAQAQSGNALNFDGSDDAVSLPTALTSGATNFTFETWLNYEDNGAWTRVFDFGDNTTINMFLTPRNGATNTPRFAITTGGAAAEQLITSPTGLSVGQHHLAVTLSQTGTVVTGTLYIDGAIAATNTAMTLTPSSLGPLTNLYLGRSEYGVDPYLKGDLDEVRVYNTALTQTQVQADMRASTGASAVPANLVAYYDFNQGIPQGNNLTETSLLDHSGNAYTGTLANFALQGNTSNWIGSTAPLPVTLVSFQVQRQQEDGLLTWATASEVKNAYFEVQNSSDGTSFHALGQVAGAGTTSQGRTYQFLDTNLARYPAVVYYRLQQVDLDGTRTYSPVRTLAVGLAGALGMEIFPTYLPTGQQLNLQVCTPLIGLANLVITDALGRTMLAQTLNLSTSTTAFSLPQMAFWKQGLYVLRVQQGSWQQTTKFNCE